MMLRKIHLGCKFLLLATALAAVPVLATEPLLKQHSGNLPTGSGIYLFEDWAGPAMRVHSFVPAGVHADTPVVFVMHGVNRDADRYLLEWIPHAEAGQFVLVVPEFDAQRFPNANGYNLGYMRESEQGAGRPPELWSFALLEPLFDAMRQAAGTQVSRYFLFGHSAGAQFVHRYVYFVPHARIELAIAANAGWYTRPELDVAYPYGLGGTAVDQAGLAAALRQPLVLYLGTSDTDPNDPNLRTAPQANEQGPHRFARGQFQLQRAQQQAENLGVDLGWQIRQAQGVGHSNGQMSEHAAQLIQ